MAKNKGMVAGKAGAQTKAPSKLTFTVKMAMKKETPGTYAYEADTGGLSADDAKIAVSSVYVRKAMVQKGYSKATVTVVLED